MHRLHPIVCVLLVGCGAGPPRAAPERNAAACARATDGVVCARWRAAGFEAPAQWSPAAFGFGAQAEYAGGSAGAPATPDLDGDGQADLCIHDRDGLVCALRGGAQSFGDPRRSFAFSAADAAGHWSSAAKIDFPDVDGDGLPDACARGDRGLSCAHGRGDGTFDPATRWASSPFRNRDGSGAADRYPTLRFADLDGDGHADVCIRTDSGISCALAGDGHFAPATVWSTWLARTTAAPASPLRALALVDIDGDGRDDLCIVDDEEVACARSDGTRFVDATAATLPVEAATSVRFGDVDGDGRSDVCLFTLAHVDCALSDGERLVPSASWHSDREVSAMRATATWLRDVNGDGRADLCTRTSDGLDCALSNGTHFVPASTTQAGFGDALAGASSLELDTLSVVGELAVDSTIRNPVAVENERPGAVDWWIPYPQWSTAHEIEAYTDAPSYSPGQRALVMLSTASAGDAVSWTLLRTGWYGGRGARRIAGGSTTGNPQPLPPAATGTSEPVRAGWAPTFNVRIPATAVSGVYVLRLDSAATNKSFFVTFVVRDDERFSDLLFERADFTDQAYNAWDGGPNNSSLYNGARWVSFDRPLRSVGALGVYSYSSGYFIFEYPMVRWLESQGYDVSYVSDVDLHRDAAPLRRAGALLSVGHNEYWSAAKRDHVEGARDAGLHLGIFGSDSVDGLIRFQQKDPRAFSRSISDSNSHKNEYARFALDLSRPPHANPSDSLTGTHYVGWCSAVFPECLADGAGKLRVADDVRIIEPEHPAFRGLDSTTGLVPRVLGYEYEAPFADADKLPFRLHVLAQAANVRIAQTSPAMVAYRAQSGALVANIASMHWAFALDPWTGRAALRTSGGERSCDGGDTDCFVRPSGPVPQITTNILVDFGALPATPSSDLVLSSSVAWP